VVRPRHSYVRRQYFFGHDQVVTGAKRWHGSQEAGPVLRPDPRSYVVGVRLITEGGNVRLEVQAGEDERPVAQRAAEGRSVNARHASTLSFPHDFHNGLHNLEDRQDDEQDSDNVQSMQDFSTMSRSVQLRP
jgi:hypothetical protein